MYDLRKGRGRWASWGSPCILSGVAPNAARSGYKSHLPVQLIFKEKIRNPVGNNSSLKGKNTKEGKQNSPTGWVLQPGHLG